MNPRQRTPGVSVRIKLTIVMSLMVICTGVLILALVYLFLLRYIPEGNLNTVRGDFAPSRRDLAQAFVPRALWALSALVLVSAAGAWLLSGRLLRPLNQLQATSLKVAAGQLSSRVKLSGPRNEFSDVADAMDQMLDEIQAQVDQQRRFAANASHELRTPLAALRATLDVGIQGAGGEEEFMRRLGGISAKAERTVQALLTLSRAESAALHPRSTDVVLLVEDVVEQLLPAAIVAGIEIDVQLPEDLHVEADADLLEHALSNLVRNAVAYGRGAIRIAGGASGSMVLLSVENEGGMLGEAQLSQMVEPFQRLDRLGSVETAGVGLGLSIVDAVARAHRGELVLSARKAGGLSATLRLPRS